MVVFKPKFIIRLACLCVLALPSLLGQNPSRKLYVDGFTTKAGSEQIRDDVIVELRKLGSVSMVSNESEADVVLGGGGEIWVQGYQSLNPRSGPSPKNGSPVYGGFLSVELRDGKGET